MVTKKPAWKFSEGRDHIVPGLFSDLFYVAASRPAQITTGQVMLLFAAALPVKAAIG